jgi:phage-related minor tail protein
MTIAETGDTSGAELPRTLDDVESKTDRLALSANSFASAIMRAFAQAATSGKQFDDVLKSLALRLSNLALQQALKPLIKSFSGSAGGILGGNAGDGPISFFGAGAIQPFAAGGVIGAPRYFPLSSGGLGLAGEAGPEAIVPLARGADGQLGVAFNGAGAAPQVTGNIATPDVASFRRSEAYITGQIARAVMRGQRNLCFVCPGCGAARSSCEAVRR